MRRKGCSLAARDDELRTALDEKRADVPVALGFPVEGDGKWMESKYRNPMDQVIKFLEEKHPDRYKVYNLVRRSRPSRRIPAPLPPSDSLLCGVRAVPGGHNSFAEPNCSPVWEQPSRFNCGNAMILHSFTALLLP